MYTIDVKLETLGSLVDTKDLYQALAEFKSMDFLPSETKRYLAFKIRESCKDMAKTAKYVQEQMDLMDPQPKKRRTKVSSGKGA